MCRTRTRTLADDMDKISDHLLRRECRVHIRARQGWGTQRWFWERAGPRGSAQRKVRRTVTQRCLVARSIARDSWTPGLLDAWAPGRLELPGLERSRRCKKQPGHGPFFFFFSLHFVLPGGQRAPFISRSLILLSFPLLSSSSLFLFCPGLIPLSVALSAFGLYSYRRFVVSVDKATTELLHPQLSLPNDPPLAPSQAHQQHFWTISGSGNPETRNHGEPSIPERTLRDPFESLIPRPAFLTGPVFPFLPLELATTSPRGQKISCHLPSCLAI